LSPRARTAHQDDDRRFPGYAGAKARIRSLLDDASITALLVGHTAKPSMRRSAAAGDEGAFRNRRLEAAADVIAATSGPLPGIRSPRSSGRSEALSSNRDRRAGIGPASSSSVVPR